MWINIRHIAKLDWNAKQTNSLDLRKNIFSGIVIELTKPSVRFAAVHGTTNLPCHRKKGKSEYTWQGCCGAGLVGVDEGSASILLEPWITPLI